ncbi:hypothetical protein [Falsiroseomonas stagni]|uniref:Uncharacterized protein n=1 Tax=Falsiroseomonas stagni DSM 19981 TaxID=1123062 RepID=A0A1I3ZE48_9PROT|nr:hypothetical protein [Falsiroseomonas stagni]SFK42262.1 hypothetical protein SAMN02745775_102429 [Falsiroseomonas stagni DSM 19981]
MSRRRQKPPLRSQKPAASTDVDSLRQSLEAMEATLRRIEAEGADAYMKRRMAEMDEARLVARGQALEAAAARAKAEAERRALSDLIDKAPGVAGWLMRRARRRAGL